MNWTWLKEQPEGQFLERKSCYIQARTKYRPRPVKDVVRDIAETLAAMANADGGTVVLGIEDDGTVSGVPQKYHIDRVRHQINAFVRPKLNFRCFEIKLEDKNIWLFETDWSAEVHQLTDGRYLLRVGVSKSSIPC